MLTPVKAPALVITPSTVPTDQHEKYLYRWKMRLYEESTLESEDHGDDFDSVAEALAHDYTVFEDLAHTRQLYPARDEQKFMVTVRVC